MNSTSDLAKATILQLDQRPHSAERASHKFRMIEIAEKAAAGIPVDEATARGRIILACEWCEKQAA
jgi:hypothetical protein